jgi:lambda family phage tail tape measure protein
MALNQDVAFNISANVSGQQAVDQLAASLKKMGDTGTMSAKQIQQEMRWLPKQFDDLARSIAAGQSPMQALYMQGSQLRDMFGGIGPAVRAVGTYIGGMLTPLNVGLTALAAFGYAAYEGAQQSAELNKQILLTGGAAGYTAGHIEEMARTLRDVQGISAGTARDLVTGLASSGQFVGHNLDLAAEATTKLQKLTGQTSDEVVKDFAAMSKGVAAWAAEHNRQFNFLSIAQFQHIKQLEEMGHTEEAMKATMQALDDALDGRKRNLGTLEKSWIAVKNAASSAWDAMLNVGRDASPEDKLNGLKSQLAALEQMGPDNRALIKAYGNGNPAAKQAFEDQKKVLIDQINALQGTIDSANKTAETKAKEEAATRQKIEEEQSGKANALRGANIAMEMAQLQGASNARLALIEQEAQRNENLYRSGLIGEEKYNADKISLEKQAFAERIALIDQEIAAEKKRPVTSQADAVNQSARVQQMRNEQAALAQAATQAELKAEGERAAFLRASRDELDKFTRSQNAHIDQIRGEADAVDMSTLEYKKHTEALRIQKEAEDAMKGKAKELRDEIQLQADVLKEATAAALDYADAKAKSFDSGAKAAVKDYVENVSNAANQAKTLFSNAFKGMEDAMVNFVKTGKLDFSSLADSIITDLIRMQVQASITGPLAAAMKGGFSGWFGGGTTAVNNSAGTGTGAVFSANGNVMTSAGPMALKKYANGGIATSPQLSIFGEGSMPEAYVPLPDGRSIPVAMKGGSKGSNVVVNVVNNTSAKASTKERTDNNGTRIIDVMIEQVKASIASDITRGTGTVTSALERTYGANRAAGAY